MRVYLGSDHAGFHLKNAMVAHLGALGHLVVDCGPTAYDPDDDYPPYCLNTATRVVADPDSLGIVIGGSGNGEQIAANKVRGARCALAYDHETATLARQHNNANLIGIGARMHSEADALQIAASFLATPFSNDARHIRRIGMLEEYERTGVLPDRG